MNYSLYWLVTEAYRKGLIDREEFKRQWGNVQALSALENTKKANGFMYVISLYKRGLIGRKEFIRQWEVVQEVPCPFKRIYKEISWKKS